MNPFIRNPMVPRLWNSDFSKILNSFSEQNAWSYIAILQICMITLGFVLYLEELVNVLPVSYTHLDVYKRQINYRVIRAVNYTRYIRGSTKNYTVRRSENGDWY